MHLLLQSSLVLYQTPHWLAPFFSYLVYESCALSSLFPKMNLVAKFPFSTKRCQRHKVLTHVKHLLISTSLAYFVPGFSLDCALL